MKKDSPKEWSVLDVTFAWSLDYDLYVYLMLAFMISYIQNTQENIDTGLVIHRICSICVFLAHDVYVRAHPSLSQPSRFPLFPLLSRLSRLFPATLTRKNCQSLSLHLLSMVVQINLNLTCSLRLPLTFQSSLNTIIGFICDFFFS